MSDKGGLIRSGSFCPAPPDISDRIRLQGRRLSCRPHSAPPSHDRRVLRDVEAKRAAVQEAEHPDGSPTSFGSSPSILTPHLYVHRPCHNNSQTDHGSVSVRHSRPDLSVDEIVTVEETDILHLQPEGREMENNFSGPCPNSLQHPVTTPFVPTPPQRTRKLYVILERASVEICRAVPGNPRPSKSGSRPTLLNCDDHQSLIAKMGIEVGEARPDITHQVGAI